MKFRFKWWAPVLVAVVVLCCCRDPDPVNEGGEDDGINWNSENNGTLTIINNTNQDMVIFKGQVPNTSSVLGGVRAGTRKDFNISDDVPDFNLGGYIVLRGMSFDEYQKNKSNLSLAKVEYSAMATYGQNAKYQTEINPQSTGDYYFKVTNAGKIGIELRKDSPDGEKVAYVPALATNYLIYSNSATSMTLFPVYVYYSNINKQVTTIKPASFGETASIGPRPVTENSVSTVRFPNDASLQWETIAANITYPVAFITCQNNVTNQDIRFASGSKVWFSQNGYDSVNSGETLVFEVTASNTGLEMTLNCMVYGGSVTVPIRTNDGKSPVITNGYDYTVTIKYSGTGNVTDQASYEAVITEGAKRDISSEITSL
jgi:hypothetical protein